MAHEITHSLDGFSNPSGSLSDSSIWHDAVAQDAAIVSDYGKTNYIEDFAETGFLAHYENVNPGGLAQYSSAASQIQHQVSAAQQLLGDLIKPGGVTQWNHHGPSSPSVQKGSAKRLSHIELKVSVNNGGWTTLKEDLDIPSFAGRRSGPPPSLVLDTATTPDAEDTKVSSSTIGYDPGFGCSIHGKEIVHPIDDIQSSDSESSEPEPTTERRCSGAEDLLGQLDNLEAARGEELVSPQTMPGNCEGIWDEVDFTSRGTARQYDDWMDEADDLEATATMPGGTRYYRVQ
ncbi:Uu.00g124990.m01.CDS01 [Anthostomella pinea]|uniref:Uu.00g124990.m01.CDS01 n=1 Tax=Anthostomella pinea TaxID=933095 RepID=A0AAI8VHP2_9PEZI|nr:Uu.00g124990.m01.CDS01 [Anthostomella pinea]